MCDCHEEKEATARAAKLGLAMAEEGGEDIPFKRRIEIIEAENGFLVRFSDDGNIGRGLFLVSHRDPETFVAKNLEEATEIILTEGRKRK